MTNQTVALIQQLASLSAKLSADEHEHGARKEALQLSRQITASLEQPQNVAIDLAFSVCLPSKVLCC